MFAVDPLPTVAAVARAEQAAFLDPNPDIPGIFGIDRDGEHPRPAHPGALRRHLESGLLPAACRRRAERKNTARLGDPVPAYMMSGFLLMRY